MSTQNFAIKTHCFPGQHLRQYPGATRHHEEDIQYLEAKQYIPLSNPHPQNGDITVLATHAVGFPKELYEPFFDVFLQQSSTHNFRIRSIWIAEASNQGASGVINERTQGDDPSPFDYPRDLLHMINLFREEFPSPIVGIGHSMGATALTHLAILHPRLLTSLILFDPIMGSSMSTDFATMFYMNSVRPDLWPSRKAAEEASKSLWREWDPKVLELWMKHAFRDTPTLAHATPGNVTLLTPKAQEGWIYCRNWFDPLPANNKDEYVTQAARAKYPDMHVGVLQTHPFYRPEDKRIWNDLPHLRPGVLYVCPAKGPTKKATDEKVRITGIGHGGSGGVEEGRVSSVVVEGVGHLLPFEKPGECAEVAAEWLGRDLGAWRERGRFERECRDDKSVDLVLLSGEWMRRAKAFYARSRREGGAKL